jgi:hypothetical protein
MTDGRNEGLQPTQPDQQIEQAQPVKKFNPEEAALIADRKRKTQEYFLNQAAIPDAEREKRSRLQIQVLAALPHLVDELVKDFKKTSPEVDADVFNQRLRDSLKSMFATEASTPGGLEKIREFLQQLGNEGIALADSSSTQGEMSVSPESAAQFAPAVEVTPDTVQTTLPETPVGVNVAENLVAEAQLPGTEQAIVAPVATEITGLDPAQPELPVQNQSMVPQAPIEAQAPVVAESDEDAKRARVVALLRETWPYIANLVEGKAPLVNRANRQ